MALIHRLENVTKVLIVGWRAQDPALLELISKTCHLPIQGHVVGRNVNDAEETIRRLSQANVPGAYEPSQFGFSGLVTTHTLDAFLRR